MESNESRVHRGWVWYLFRTGIAKGNTFQAKTADISNYGMLFFALATVAFGVQNFVYGDFVMGRAPAWPSPMPGQLVWAYVSGVILIVLGLAVAIGKNSVTAAISIAVIVFIWAMIRHMLSGHWHWGTEITQTGKALVLFSGALCAAGILSGRSSHPVRLSYWFIEAGRFSVAAFFIICGIEHFMFVDFVKHLVPEWIPGNEIWTYLTGVTLIAGGIGIMAKQTMSVAAFLSGVMVFIWFIILHIPRAVMITGDRNEWVAVFEALAVSGIAFMLSGSSAVLKNPNR